MTSYMTMKGDDNMWTPCDVPVEEWNEETQKMEIHYHCPYSTGDPNERISCRDLCSLGVDE